MRTALIATVQAVPGVPHRFPLADKITRRFILATANADDGNYVILKPFRSRVGTHYLWKQDGLDILNPKFQVKQTSQG
jgi:hypothetical protein